MAAYDVTLPIYSGRPNPSWKIHPSHASFKKIKEHHERARASNATYHPKYMVSKLGYKGFVLHHEDLEHPHLIVGPETVELQKALLRSVPAEMKTDVLHQKILQMIDDSSALATPAVAAPAPPIDAPPSAYGPLLDLGKWNNDWNITWNNNCYNYGNDKITNTFAQPGRASGYHPTSITADEYKKAAMSDGLKMLEPQPGPQDPSPTAPPNRWVVALMVAQGVDFHWYRLDSNALWSHKPGSTNATRYDGRGDLISDPRNAANAKGGADYKFVAFMTSINVA